MGDFAKTPKQREACDVLNRNMHTLLFGGAGSAKSFIAVRQVVVRALLQPSRHLMVRLKFHHAKTTLGHETMPAVLEKSFPNLEYTHNKSDWFWRFGTQRGGHSEIWLSGIDDKERSEKVLGHEYATIFANEISQIPFDSIVLLQTRLRQKCGLPLRFIYDCNPPPKSHWSYRYFMRGQTPEKIPHGMAVGSLLMNPGDNLENLSPEYMKILESLPRRQRQRFLEGLWLDDVEGALWTDAMVELAKLHEPIERSRTVVAIDPSVSNNPTSDECGLGVASADGPPRPSTHAMVEKDLSGRMSTKAWAQRAVNAYHEYDANYIVAETNQGGDLVEDVIHNIDPTIMVKKVHAKKGKFARAEPVSMLYEQGRVGHSEAMPELEEQLTTYVPQNTKGSPDRLDWLVYALTDLMLGEEQMIHIG